MTERKPSLLDRLLLRLVATHQGSSAIATANGSADA